MMMMTFMTMMMMMMMTHISDSLVLLVGAPHISNAISIAGRVLGVGNNWTAGWIWMNWMDLDAFG